MGDAFQRLCSSIVDDQWNLPTPCTDWDVGQLVDHVIGGNWFTIHILEGQSADEAMAAAIASFTPDFDRTGAAIASTRSQRDLFVQPGVLAGCYSHVAGDLAGSEVLRVRLHEMIIHGWDLATAIHPPANISDDLVGWALADLATPDSVSAQLFEITESELSNHEVDPQVRLLAAFGRSRIQGRIA